jgi:hypothetical protein
MSKDPYAEFLENNINFRNKELENTHVSNPSRQKDLKNAQNRYEQQNANRYEQQNAERWFNNLPKETQENIMRTMDGRNTGGKKYRRKSIKRRRSVKKRRTTLRKRRRI